MTKIKVKLRVNVEDLGAAGDVVEIDETKFDQEIHEKVERSATEVMVGALTDALDAHTESIRTEVRETLEGLAEPDRTTLRAIHGGVGGVRISRDQPTSPLYRSLYRQADASGYGEEVRAMRTPDVDHHNAEWLRALVNKDRERMKEAEDKLAELTRATTLEGALDASDPTAILDGTGGHLLPQPLANVVMIARDEVAVLPAHALPLDLSSATLRVPTAGAMTAEMVAEGSTASQGEPPFTSEMLKAQKAQAKGKTSVEMLADSDFNVVSIFSVRAGAALGALEDVQICTSNGTAPNISEAIGGGNVNEATSTVLIYEDLVTLFFALGKQYRPNARWYGNATTLTLLSQLMDGNDHPILSMPGSVAPVGDTPGAVGSIFGKPVYEVPLASGTLLFGDPRGYAFGRREGIRVATSEHADFDSDLVNFKFTERFDGRIIDDVALKQMAGLATVA